MEIEAHADCRLLSDWFEAVPCAGMAWCKKEALGSSVRACQSRLWAARVSQPQLVLPPPSSGGHIAVVVTCRPWWLWG